MHDAPNQSDHRRYLLGIKIHGLVSRKVAGTSYVLELVPLWGKNEFELHPQNEISVTFGVLFKISDDQPHHFSCSLCAVGSRAPMRGGEPREAWEKERKGLFISYFSWDSPPPPPLREPATGIILVKELTNTYIFNIIII